MHDKVVRLHEPNVLDENSLLVVTRLSDSDSNVRWVHALSYGKFKHPVFGEQVIDHARIQRMKNNIKSDVRGIDLYINYDHREHTGEAAGWIRDARIQDNGLWLKVEFTDDAVQKIRKGGYKYFSSEFTNKWEDPKTGQTYKDVMIGGALTNVPFLKDLEPLSLSEITQEERMDREALLKLLGLEPDATEEQITEKVNALTEKQAGEDDLDLDDLEIQVGDPNEEGVATITVKRGERSKEFQVEAPKAPASNESAEEDELAALAEKHPEVATLMERVGHLETAQKLSEVQVTLSEVGKEHDKALSPAAKKKLQGLMLNLSESASKDFVAVLNDIADPKGSGFVDLSEKGTTRTDGNGGGDEEEPTDEAVKFAELVETAKADEANKNMTYAEVIRKVANEHPDEYEAYRTATTH